MSIVLVSTLFLLFFSRTLGRPLFDKEATTEPLNVHLVPHSHDDVGWLKTVDEYYYGADNNIQHARVQFIIDSVVEELMKDKERKFIYVEMAFFTRWWNEQTDDTREKVYQLVQNGQLEFINGGWCMNDEASTHYNAIIDQMSIGLRFISSTFNVHPSVGWHIDPFGHSAVQASLFSLMGFDSFFFGRIDYDDKRLRLNNSEMEMIWEGSQSLGKIADIFTGVLYNTYFPPKGFCFDSMCSNPPIMDDDKLFGYNVKQRIEDFVKAAYDQAKHYKTNNIMMTMGGDFQYENAEEWYTNLDKLIKYVNMYMNGSVNVMYSTPSLYTQYINKEKNMSWSVKSDDFFPYADKPWSFWTGYFTSRPALKGYVRRCNSLLQACKQLEAIHNGLNNGLSSIKLQQAMGVAQHHDAVSGTEKQHVADDYAERLHIGQVECQEVMATVLNDLFVKTNAPKMDLSFCEYLNISVCPITESGNFNMVIYNSLARQWTGMVRVPIIKETVTITDPDGNTIPVQLVPISNITKGIRRHIKTNVSTEVEAVFQVTVPPLGYAIYTARTSNKQELTQISQIIDNINDDLTVSNDYYKVVFDGTSGQMKTVTNLMSGISSSINQQFYWYLSSTGNKNSTQASGAYIFRPKVSTVFPVNDNNNKAHVSVIEGNLVTEVHQVFAPWVSQVVRLYQKMPAVELEYTVGPIPFNDGFGKEIISHFQTDFKTNGIWYTDANGREMQKRERNYRPTWKYNNTCPIAGNYYPVNSRIFIKDESRNVQFTILNDRSQGGSSIVDGSLELMVHRRTLKDDNRGVHEPLNETGQYGDGLIIRGKYLLLLDDTINSTYHQRMMAEKLMLEPELAFGKSNDDSFESLSKNYNLKYTGLSTALPDNVHLLTLEHLDDSTVLLRLDHQFEASDPPPWSAPASVKLRDLFNGINIKDVTELALGGNVPLSSINKLQWMTNDKETVPSPLQFPAVKGPDYIVSLYPMMIRTFNVTIEFTS